MKNSTKIWSALILFLFLFPVLINYLPDSSSSATSKLIKEPALIVYASNVLEEVVPETKDGKALLYFTHSHEAFEPITKAKDGKVAVSHQAENITKFGDRFKDQLGFNGIATDILDIDNMNEMKKNSIPYHRAYAAIRPHVKKKIDEGNYDFVIDIHRDSLGPNKTTVTHAGERYAKVAFVIGTEHPNYKHNEKIANLVKAEMERQVPGITRNIILKGGKGVDGKYNQDLHPSAFLLELGGYGNTEDELNRTIVVAAEASKAIMSKK